MSVPTRSPSTAPSASIKIDFPAPVSPVRALSPGPNLMFTASMMAKLRISSSISMARQSVADARRNPVALQKTGHAVDAAAGLDAFADVNRVTTTPASS